MARHDEAKAGGLFDRIGNFVVRWPLIVIGCWIAVAAALTLLLPTLQAQAAKREQAPLPPGAPSMVLQKEMSAAFQEKIETSALLLVLLTNENGLGPADEAVYRKLIENLRADTQDKISVQDFLAVPEMKELLASKDNKAWNLPITFAGDAASPETQAAFKRVAAIVKQTVAGTSLTVHLSGPIATVADLTELGEKDVRIIEIGTAVSVLIILILVYRNLVTMLVPLATIGASVVTAQGTLSGLAEFGLAVNMQAIVFMSAVMIGAGTDYAVFLISRYHDYVRHGEKSDMAVKKALMSIGKVITASAATVAVTFLAMVFTKLEVFSAVIRFNYDDLKTVPQHVESVKGYEAMNRHFPMNAMTPMVLFIKSPRDLRTPGALADIEMMSREIAELPNIVMVRGLTRPNGEPLKETKVSFQAGEVGGKLDEATTLLEEHGGELDQLTGGAHQLADALAQIRNEINGAVASSSGIVNTLQAMMDLMGGDKTIRQLENASQYVGRMRALGDNLSGTVTDAEQIATWASPMVNALNSSPVCNSDPACRTSRAQLAAIVQAQDDGLLRSIRALAVTLQQTQEYQTLARTVSTLDGQLKQVVSTLKAVDGLPTKLAQMQQGANALADGSAALAAGVQELVDQVKKMGSGLNEAADFLLGIKRDADKPSMAGFNIPPQIFSRDEFKKGAQIFLSADGHAARYFVQSALNPATTEAMDQVNDILRVADSARPNTELEDATIGLAGVPTALRDIRDYYNSDMKFIVIATIVIVFLILVILLRALVAPIYLIGSVLISYLSALGIGTLVFQLILGQEMHWSLPGLSFILLVAIGADYNMLLISRIRDESPHGIRIGVIRTVGSTGGVITSAGLIFAASMFGLVGASINTMAQAGFTIGIGIVLDTFLVRTVTVPALTTMIGRANWWPSELGRDPSTPPTKADRWLRRVKGHRRKAPIPAPKPPHTKVVRNTNGHASKAATKSVPNGKPADLAEGNGEYLIDHLRRHSLPLFGYAAMPAYDVVDGVSKPNGDGAHIGKEPVDHLLGHSLPLFGLAGLPSYDRWDDTSIGEPAVGHAGSKPDAKLST